MLFRFISLLILSATIGCGTSPKGHKQLLLVPDDQIQAMGTMAFEEMKTKTAQVSSPKTIEYVRCIVNDLTSEIIGKDASKSWEVAVFKDDTANAFALPGGKIGVFSGMLKVADNPDQLATVIAHEIGHVLANHSNARVSEQLAAHGGLQILNVILGEPGPRKDILQAALGIGAQYGIILPHNREQEKEADLIGVDLMVRAGYNPAEAVELWKELQAKGGPQPPEFLATHPSHGSRIEYLTNYISKPMKIEAKSNLSCKKPKLLSRNGE